MAKDFENIKKLERIIRGGTPEGDTNAKLRNADEMKKRINIPDACPPGSWLSQYIRAIHMNSVGLFPPSTAGSNGNYNKYNTVTHLSFQGPPGFSLLDFGDDQDFPRKRETVEDVLLEPRKHQNFHRWKVPERLVDDSPAPVPIPVPAGPDDDVHTLGSGSIKPVKSEEVASQPPPSRLSRQMSPGYSQSRLVPNIPLKTGGQTPRPESKNNAAPAKLPCTPRRSKTSLVDVRKSPVAIQPTIKEEPEISVEQNQESLQNALRPEAVPQAAEWMKKAGSAEKKVIERVLKMAGRKHEVETALNRSLLPDAKEEVEKWMESATEQERQVAVNFFGSLAGGQLMGMTVNQKRERLQQVLKTLEHNSNQGYSIRPKTKTRKLGQIDTGRLRYVRMLTPNTRKDRWMYTTWHHLPEYREDNIVGNWSSHYIRPHAQIPRHFVIHPDWG